MIKKLAALFWKSERERELDRAFDEAVQDLDLGTNEIAVAREKLEGASRRFRDRVESIAERPSTDGSELAQTS